MIDISKISEPIEVWNAAMGDPSDLAALLRSDEPLTDWHRHDLALLLEGRLAGPNGRGRGAPKKTTGGPFAYLFDPVYSAIYDYRNETEKGEQAMAEVAARHELDIETFRNALRRGKAYKAPKRSFTKIEKFREWYKRDFDNGFGKSSNK
ncbi:hypothetical protein OO012_19830 [Rhodobacteraceae bacterium KMM 6894]|nr:hypothetical protein [Rhodobacteraceae bacterium KMM 6894]